MTPTMDIQKDTCAFERNGEIWRRDRLRGFSSKKPTKREKELGLN